MHINIHNYEHIYAKHKNKSVLTIPLTSYNVRQKIIK